MISISGRRRAMTLGDSPGRSQDGRRVPEAPCGRREELLVASMIVYQAVWEESVFWMRQRERLWRDI